MRAELGADYTAVLLERLRRCAAGSRIPNLRGVIFGRGDNLQVIPAETR
jgi:hypothetical protein